MRATADHSKVSARLPCEPPRDCRRVNSLSGCGQGSTERALPRGAWQVCWDLESSFVEGSGRDDSERITRLDLQHGEARTRLLPSTEVSEF
jgi:hypothetical protein